MGTGRGRRARHETVEATLDWSYALLDEAQHSLLRRCGVLAGPFDIDAVAVVCADTGETRATLAARLGSPVDKSLVMLDGPRGQYRMLETIRAYGLRELEAAGEVDSVAAQHWRWVLAATPGPWHWSFARVTTGGVEADLDNLRAALEWCKASGRTELAVRLAAWAGPIWFHAATGAEGLRWVRLGPTIDRQLSLDERLAWRTTAAWCHAASAWTAPLNWT